ncbi:MAG: DUF2809 domain-containing protein [Janthinobacterium lividum]
MKQEVILPSQVNWLYGAGCLLSVEVFIAAFLHDRIVRPYVGDLLAVIFLYCLVRSVAEVPARPAILAVLVVAYVIEISQYFHLTTHLGVGHSRVALLVLGSHFSWVDMGMYTLGALGLVGLEQVLAARRGPRLVRR